MDKLKDEITGALNCIRTENDIVTAAKLRANETPQRTARLRHLFAPMIALAVICGVTVTAVTLGWTDMIFGETAQIIEENIDDYRVNIGNISIVKTNPDMPYDFTVGDVISDGEIMYFNLIITRTDGKSPENIKGFRNDMYVKLKSGSSGDFSYISLNWEPLTVSENGCVNSAGFISPDCGINEGDSYQIYFQNFYPIDENDSSVNQKNEFLNNNVIISFDILDDVTDMSRTIEVNQTVTFTDKYSENSPCREMAVRNIVISPLKLTVNGSCLSSDDSNQSTVYVLGGELTLMMKNGERKPLTSRPFGGIGMLHSQHTLRDDTYCSIRINNFFDSVIPLDDIEAVEIGDVTVPIE